MQRNDQKKQKKSKGLLPLAAVILILLPVLEEMDSGVFALLALLLILLVPVGIVVALLRFSRKKRNDPHTHDRIDHRTDLKINPQTGKTEARPIRTAAQHSPREHWKQQLDGLLANGTIDKAEYRALLNRKF